MIRSRPWGRAFIIFGLFALALRYWLPAEVIEQYYSRGAYLFIHRFLTGLFAWWPVTASPFIIGILLVVWGWLCAPACRGKTPPIRRMYQFLFGLVAGLALIVGLFFFLWGFNYGRVPVEQQLGLVTEAPAPEFLLTDLQRTVRTLSVLRTWLEEDYALAADTTYAPFAELDYLVKDAVKEELRELGFPAVRRTVLRHLVPGILLRFGTSGIYFPLTGEANVDDGLHPLKLPPVMAHELFHAHGITDEGTCNFLAYLACIHSNDLRLRYTGHLSYYRYLAAAVRRINPQYSKEAYAALSAAVRTDLERIENNLRTYREVAPAVRNAIYDSYLRGQGVREGLASYGRFIDLVAAWRNAQPQRPEMPVEVR